MRDPAAGITQICRLFSQTAAQKAFALVFFLQLVHHLLLGVLNVLLAALAGHALVGLDCIHIAVVFVADMAEQPARQHGVQLLRHIFTRFKAGLHFAHTACEQFMHALVQVCKCVAGVFQHALFVGEVRDGVVHGFCNHFTQRCTVWRLTQLVQAVDVVHDATMLNINFFNARIQIFYPLQNSHRTTLCHF